MDNLATARGVHYTAFFACGSTNIQYCTTERRRLAQERCAGVRCGTLTIESTHDEQREGEGEGDPQAIDVNQGR